MKDNRNKKLIIGILITLAVLLVGFIALGIAAGGLEDREEAPSVSSQPEKTEETKNVETPKTPELPKLNESDYTRKEGLVVFKELDAKGYEVTAKYVNEKVSAANQDLTEQFKKADVNKCEDRLGYDAYIVKSISQSDKKVAITLDNEPTMNQNCPEGTN